MALVKRKQPFYQGVIGASAEASKGLRYGITLLYIGSTRLPTGFHNLMGVPIPK